MRKFRRNDVFVVERVDPHVGPMLVLQVLETFMSYRISCYITFLEQVNVWSPHVARSTKHNITFSHRMVIR
jgi:hypothetical protein